MPRTAKTEMRTFEEASFRSVDDYGTTRQRGCCLNSLLLEVLHRILFYICILASTILVLAHSTHRTKILMVGHAHNGTIKYGMTKTKTTIYGSSPKQDSDYGTDFLQSQTALHDNVTTSGCQLLWTTKKLKCKISEGKATSNACKEPKQSRPRRRLRSNIRERKAIVLSPNGV